MKFVSIMFTKQKNARAVFMLSLFRLYAGPAAQKISLSYPNLFLSFLMSLPDQLSEQQTASLQVDVVQLQEHHHHGHCVLLTVDYHGVDTKRD